MRSSRRLFRSQTILQNISFQQRPPAQRHQPSSLRHISTPQDTAPSIASTPQDSLQSHSIATPDPPTDPVIPKHNSANDILGFEIPSRTSSTQYRMNFKKQADRYVFKQDLFSNPWAPHDTITHSLSLGAFPSPAEFVNGYETNARSSTDDTPATTVASSQGNPKRIFHPMRSRESLDEQTRACLDELRKLLEFHQNRDPKSVPINNIFELYNSLPVPRVCYLTHKELRILLIILGRQNDGLNSVATYHMNLIRDMQDNKTPVLLPEWTRLVDTIGKGFKIHKDVRMDVVRQILADMGETGLKPDIVLFTSLLSIAVRQNNAHLVQTILGKMRDADIKHNLITWTEYIKFAGLQRDVKMIHTVFEEFAKTKIIVDIVFINELLEAFFNASQPHLAELIYLRLRGFAETCFKKGAYPPVRSKIQARAERRAITKDIRIQRRREIEVELRQRRIDPATLRLPDGSPTQLYKQILLSVGVKTTPYNTMLVPNNGTIRQFISYHCHYTGRMRDVSFYLNDMDQFCVPATYGTYVDILHGFFLWHRPDGDWNAERLENVFSIIRKGVIDGNPQVRITYVLALTAIRAYGTVFGGREAREVWELLRPWLRINENALAWERNLVNQLEQVVVKFEQGLSLGYAMSGGDVRWRVRDWRQTRRYQTSAANIPI